MAQGEKEISENGDQRKGRGRSRLMWSETPGAVTKGYLSDPRKLNWFQKGFLLTMFFKDAAKICMPCKGFVSHSPEKRNKIMRGKKLPLVLGSKDFLNWTKGKSFKEKRNGEEPQWWWLTPESVFESLSEAPQPPGHSGGRENSQNSIF